MLLKASARVLVCTHTHTHTDIEADTHAVAAEVVRNVEQLK